MNCLYFVPEFILFLRFTGVIPIFCISHIFFYLLLVMCVCLFCFAFWWQTMNMDLVFSEIASTTSVLQLIEVLYVSLYSTPPATIINFISLYLVLGYNSSSHIFLHAHSLCVRSTVEDKSVAAALFIEVWGLLTFTNFYHPATYTHKRKV